MEVFAVPHCNVKGCLKWRPGDKCAKHGANISRSIKYLANLHTNNNCEVRRQIDAYRLEQMLED